MTITIDPFWMGVISTIGAEFIALVIYTVITIVKTRRNASN